MSSNTPTFVSLNHLLIFVDQKTYSNIAASDFLKHTLAWGEERTTIDQENNASWTGCYYYGHQTYFEFMNPEATTWKPRDGIAFGVEEPAAGTEVRDNLARKLNLDVQKYVRGRQYKEQTIPWFDMIEYERPDDAHLISWIMAYQPVFLQEWEPHLPPAAGGTSRQAVLERYRSRLGEAAGRNERLFHDIDSVTIALPEDEQKILRQELEVYGYTINHSTGHDTCQGSDITIILETCESSQKGIRAFTIQLNRARTTPEIYTFGDSCTLTFSGDQMAEWRFW